MPDDLPDPAAAPPGWYADGGPGLRWWDGTAWTEHRAVRPPAARAPGRQASRLRAGGAALLAVALMAVTVAGLSLMGDPYPISRAGVASTSGSVSVVNAVCPGERLAAVRLSFVSRGAAVELWHIEGDTPLPDRLVMGEVPPGMRVVTPLRALPGDGVLLSLDVTTDELDNSYPLDFALQDVPASGVLGFGVTYPDVASFEQAALDDTPCGDPYSRRGALRVALVVLLGAAVAGVAGVALIVAGRRRASSPAARLGA